jgi:hypothetical protein
MVRTLPRCSDRGDPRIRGQPAAGTAERAVRLAGVGRAALDRSGRTVGLDLLQLSIDRRVRNSIKLKAESMRRPHPEWFLQRRLASFSFNSRSETMSVSYPGVMQLQSTHLLLVMVFCSLSATVMAQPRGTPDDLPGSLPNPEDVERVTIESGSRSPYTPESLTVFDGK